MAGINTEDRKVAIILCSLNGAAYIRDQLESIKNQTHKNWDLWVFDDGSTDETIKIVQDFDEKLKANKLFYSLGPNKGFAQNFVQGILEACEGYDFISLSDQDDIWHAKKLERAIEMLCQYDLSKPVLYGSRTKLVDAQGSDIGLSKFYGNPPSLANALVQNIAGGNTMVFNKQVVQLLSNIPKDAYIASHDWLIYQLVMLADGHFYYDQSAYIDYRQHESNLVGSNMAAIGKIKRLFTFLSGKKKSDYTRNLDLLTSVEITKTEDAKQLLFTFLRRRNSNLFVRLKFCVEPLVARQSKVESAILIFGLILGLA